ncbi:putative sugar nucleotidyl transferase [Tunicatimonas pelagia]|uniref:putative sugar nucleotidyl transferase n=1 Tax=Tunicatimonas pelagia TaxID=931531 RepID=UPI00266592BD|nr:putative sugar nucleotidyl transferase [Tunicatimonas pelagia]WKN41740.1 putative sugar nucleotidyl transferase [Tunicatimonas pelagia]
MQLVFVDLPNFRDSLKPFTLTRPVATLRVGIRTLGEKWQMYLAEEMVLTNPSYLTVDYLQSKYSLIIEEDNLLVNPAVCPNTDLIQRAKILESRTVLFQGDCFIAARVPGEDLQSLSSSNLQLGNLPALLSDYRSITYAQSIVKIQQVWDIFQQNGSQIEADYAHLTQNRSSATITDKYTRTYGDSQIFVEEGANIKAAIINAESGPVYLGKNTTIHENAVIKGPFAMLEGAHVNMGAKVREATTIGPSSKIGGEVKNIVVQANSNKGHEGFVGNSVIGEWCNFGADSNTSNLKNNYQPVQLWDYRTRELVDSGQTFCGLMMGDHSKCGINTMFNTGTTVGVFANLFGGGFLPKFVPSFSWGGSESLVEFRFAKAVEVLERVLGRRNQRPDPNDLDILKHISQHRSSEFS